MKTNVYVDGFNLYHGCLQNTPYRWLNLLALCQKLLPNNEIARIRYFSARVDARPHDLDQPNRQQTYWRALRTLPNLSIYEGRFQVKPTRMRLSQPPPGGPHTVEVLKTEEKGSDVNIASFLLLDAFQNDCEASIVISNDSDLATPIRLCRKELKHKIVVLHPLRSELQQIYWPSFGGNLLPANQLPRASYDLKKTGAVSQIITEAALQSCQFPPTIPDAIGTITKPALW